ncbi:MAG: hypothetical protein CK424_07235 [Legionella sp.]|nr:MAG: hypothetical protein CK424_07235 [Legionella sp.]
MIHVIFSKKHRKLVLLKQVALVLLFFPVALFAAKLPKIQGLEVNNEILLNVQHRLTERYQGKSIQAQPEADLKSEITKALEPYGYFKPHIVIASPKGQLNIMIHPGPRIHISGLNIQIVGEGASNPDIQHALHDIPIHIGQGFETNTYEATKNALSNTAETQGYIHASFTTAQVLIDTDRNTADILLILDTGPRYYYGQVTFDPTHISPDLLKRYVPFKLGEPYSTEQLLKLNSNLAGSGYFNAVDVLPTLANSNKLDVPIHVSLKPVKRITYNIGLGYGTDTGPRGRLGVNVIPVNRAGHKFNMIAQGSFVQNTVQGQYIIPGRNPINDNYIINGGYTHLDFSAGRSSGVLLGVGQQHIVPSYQRTLSVNALDENYKYTSLQAESARVFFPKILLTWYQHSDTLFSPTGYKITLSGLAASKALLSDTSLAQALIDARAAFVVAPIRTRLFLHSIQSLTSIQQITQLPLSLAPLLGGAEDMKGYAFNSIGPGKTVSYAGIEIQKETWDKVYFYGLLDAGTTYNPVARIGYYDAGLGVMWVSPVGPIKIAVAQAIHQNVQQVAYQHPRLVVTIGPDL